MTMPLSLKPKGNLPSSLKPKQQQQQSQEEPSLFKKFSQDVASSTPVQVGLGLAQAATAPLDLMKMYLTGEALQGLDEAEEVAQKEGRAFDKEKERAKVLDVLEKFPTLSLAEETLEKYTGISTHPKDRLGKVMRLISEFAGLGPKGAKAPKLQSKALSAEGKAIRSTGEEFGLRKFAGIEAEKPPIMTPVASQSKQAELAKELNETSKQAIDQIIEQKIPVKKMKEMGIDLEGAYESAYSAARKTASEMEKKPLDISNVVDWIETEIKKTKGSSPSLSKQQNIYVDILNQEKKNLIKSNQKTKYDLVTGKKNKPLLKDMSADQALNQYRNYNDNVKGIWKKPEFSGSENTVKNAYAGLNDQIINSIDKANPQLANELKFANKVFHETSKLGQVEGILAKSFDKGYNPNKLAKTLGNKRERQFLERNIGKDGVKDLERIAKYGQKAEEKVLSQLKSPKTIKQYLEEMTPAQLALIVGFKSHVGQAYYLPKAVLQRVQGHLLTRNTTKKDYISFMKEAAQLGSNPQPLFYAARKLQKSIEDEFGSEEMLLNLSQSEDQE